MNSDKGTSLLAAASAGAKSKGEESGVDPAKAAEKEAAKQEKLTKMAERLASTTESRADTKGVLKQRRREAKQMITTSARWSPDNFEAMQGLENQFGTPKVMQYNKALEYWFKNGHPMQFE